MMSGVPAFATQVKGAAAMAEKFHARIAPNNRNLLGKLHYKRFGDLQDVQTFARLMTAEIMAQKSRIYPGASAWNSMGTQQLSHLRWARSPCWTRFGRPERSVLTRPAASDPAAKASGNP